MNRRIILRAAALAVLTVTAMLLGWLCFGRQDTGSIISIDAPKYIAGEPDYSVNIPIFTAPDAAAKTEPVVETKDAAETVTVVTNRLGTLTIGNTQIPVAANVDERTMEESPGWMPDSALPGETGMCVILGHRNRKHLRPLENVKIGDEITFTYPDGRTATYTVSETTIYESTADWHLPSAAGDTLVLVTCWPFRYWDRQKYLVPIDQRIETGGISWVETEFCRLDTEYAAVKSSLML